MLWLRFSHSWCCCCRRRTWRLFRPSWLVSACSQRKSSDKLAVMQKTKGSLFAVWCSHSVWKHSCPPNSSLKNINMQINRMKKAHLVCKGLHPLMYFTGKIEKLFCVIFFQSICIFDSIDVITWYSDTWLLCSFSLSASNYIFISPCQPPFLSSSLSVCIQLQISVFLCLRWAQFLLPSLSLYIEFHSSVLMYIHVSLTVPFAASDSKYFHPFLSLAVQLFAHACLFLLSVSFLLHLFLSLSVSICLRGQVCFSEGCTLTWWNGVSLFLQWWPHFAVRITTPDIDGQEGEGFRGQHELAGRRGEASKRCTHTALVHESEVEVSLKYDYGLL